MSISVNNKFKFWCPIEKAQEVNSVGDQMWTLGGIASTIDKDSDGEFLNPNGFDIQPLLQSGLVNWHHQVKGQPAAIIGEPIEAEIRPEGLWIKANLYKDSKMAREVWELAEVLEKNSRTRRLGYSIEGKVVKRKSNDKNHPDFKIIEKAIITGVAVTHQPKNPKTFANIIKGEIDNELGNGDEDEDEEVEKDLNTENGKVLKKESVNKKIKRETFSKSELIDRIFEDVPGISISKAEKIKTIFNKIANMNGRKLVTEDDISKAYEALGIEMSEDDIFKAEEKEEKKKVDEVEEDEVDEKEEVEETDEDEVEEDEVDEDETVEKAVKGNRFDRIEKSLATSHLHQTSYIKALGVMVKDVSQKASSVMEKNEKMLEIIKAQEETIFGLSSKLEEYGSSTPAPKSLKNARPVERSFAKANDSDITKGDGETVKQNSVSMSRQANVVAEILDQAAFNKGYDEEFSKACTHFEAMKGLPQNIISRIKNEMGINIIK